MITTQTNSLPPVAVLGVGAVTPMGRGVSEIAARLSESPVQNSPVQNSPLRVSDEVLADPGLSRSLRRADRFTRMAVMAAGDAWKAAQKFCEGIAPERVGIILSSGLGPHCRGFKFLDGMLDEGDAAASPTDFSHSVHGAACAYITALLDVRGPSLTLTDFESGFEQAVTLAQMWIHDRACDRVIVGAVEELGEVLLQCAGRMTPNVRSGEGALFLVLGPDGTAGGTAKLNASEIEPVDMRKIGQTSTDEFAKRFGYSASATAFQWLDRLVRSP